MKMWISVLCFVRFWEQIEYVLSARKKIYKIYESNARLIDMRFVRSIHGRIVANSLTHALDFIARNWNRTCAHKKSMYSGSTSLWYHQCLVSLSSWDERTHAILPSDFFFLFFFYFKLARINICVKRSEKASERGRKSTPTHTWSWSESKWIAYRVFAYQIAYRRVWCGCQTYICIGEAHRSHIDDGYSMCLIAYLRYEKHSAFATITS